MAYARKNELLDNTILISDKTIEENKTSFLGLLRMTKRNGIEDLINYLDKETDFFTAPASSRFHGNYKGALCEHSLNVCKCLNKMNKDFKLGVPNESIILTSLLHDTCKANQYKKVKKVFKNDDENKWYDYMTYEYSNENSIPLGHGEKSIMKIMDFIRLTDLEKVMIRWHMGLFEEGALKAGLNDAMNYHKGVSALHLSDMQASQFFERTVDHKELPHIKHARLIQETNELARMQNKQ